MTEATPRRPDVPSLRDPVFPYPPVCHKASLAEEKLLMTPKYRRALQGTLCLSSALSFLYAVAVAVSWVGEVRRIIFRDRWRYAADSNEDDVEHFLDLVGLFIAPSLTVIMSLFIVAKLAASTPTRGNPTALHGALGMQSIVLGVYGLAALCLAWELARVAFEDYTIELPLIFLCGGQILLIIGTGRWISLLYELSREWMNLVYCGTESNRVSQDLSVYQRLPSEARRLLSASTGHKSRREIASRTSDI